MYFASHGIADPEDLSLLRAVLDRYCREKGIAVNSAEGDALAAILLDQFRQGTRDPEALLTAVARTRH